VYIRGASDLVLVSSSCHCHLPRVTSCPRVCDIYIRCQFNAASMLFLCSSHCLTIEDLFPLLLCKYAPLVILPFHSMYVSVMYLRCDHMFFCSAGLRAFYISLLISNSADIVSLLSICRRYIYGDLLIVTLYISCYFLPPLFVIDRLSVVDSTANYLNIYLFLHRVPTVNTAVTW